MNLVFSQIDERLINPKAKQKHARHRSETCMNVPIESRIPANSAECWCDILRELKESISNVQATLRSMLSNLNQVIEPARMIITSSQN